MAAAEVMAVAGVATELMAEWMARLSQCDGVHWSGQAKTQEEAQGSAALTQKRQVGASRSRLSGAQLQVAGQHPWGIPYHTRQTVGELFMRSW